MRNGNTKNADQTTGAARLRMEMHTPTRIVRRVIDVSMTTKLPALANIIRTGRGWVKNRPYEFRLNGETYRHRAGLHRKGCRSVHGRKLGDVLGEARSFTFIHHITAERSQRVDVETLAKSEDESAFPRLIEALGTLALGDLTPDDRDHQYTMDAANPQARNRRVAVQMCGDEELRALADQAWVKLGIDAIRQGERRPRWTDLERMQGSGLEHLRAMLYGGPEHDIQVATRLTAGLPGERTAGRPLTEIRNGRALLTDDSKTRDIRDKCRAWQATGAADNNSKNRAKACERLAREAPGDIAVLATYGKALEEIGEWRAAIDAYSQAVVTAMTDLPTRFDGPVETTTESGLGLIEAATGLARCECDYASTTRGIRMYERAVQWEPDKANEAALRLGSEYVHSGLLDKAVPLLERLAARWAPYDYDLALCRLLRREWTDAVTATRRALVTNPYIAEALWGVRRPLEVRMGQTKRGRTMNTALEYIRRYGHTWRVTDEATKMLKWVAAHPVALAERALLRTPDYGAGNENDPSRASKLNNQFHEQLAAMDKGLSEAMLSEELGGTRRPWSS